MALLKIVVHSSYLLLMFFAILLLLSCAPCFVSSNNTTIPIENKETGLGNSTDSIEEDIVLFWGRRRKNRNNGEGEKPVYFPVHPESDLGRYVGDVKIGTRGPRRLVGKKQPMFKMLFDTSTPLTWVYDCGAKEDLAKKQNEFYQYSCYDPENTFATHEFDGGYLDATYLRNWRGVDGASAVDGTKHLDRFRFGDFPIRKFHFASLYSIVEDEKKEGGGVDDNVFRGRMDGVLGLGLKNRFGKQKNNFGYVAFHFASKGHEEVSFGDVLCENRYGGQLEFTDVDAEAEGWQLPMDVELGDKSISKKVTAKFHSAAHTNFAPMKHVQEIAKLTGGGETGHNTGVYARSCDENTKQLVNLELTIGGEARSFTPAEYYTLDPEDSGRCLLFVVGVEGQKDWRLGVPFFQKYMVVLDFAGRGNGRAGQQRIGLALAKDLASGESDLPPPPPIH